MTEPIAKRMADELRRAADAAEHALELIEDNHRTGVVIRARALSTLNFAGRARGLAQEFDALLTDEERAADPVILPGATLIDVERQRQVELEGFDAEQDAQYTAAELTQAAMSYAYRAHLQIAEIAGVGMEGTPPPFWPPFWSLAWWKPSADPVRNLIKAGALIAAEIDRIQTARAHALKSKADNLPVFQYVAAIGIGENTWNSVAVSAVSIREALDKIYAGLLPDGAEVLAIEQKD